MLEHQHISAEQSHQPRSASHLFVVVLIHQLSSEEPSRAERSPVNVNVTCGPRTTSQIYLSGSIRTVPSQASKPFSQVDRLEHINSSSSSSSSSDSEHAEPSSMTSSTSA
ncbi:hypothetical protein AND_003478 [Anopheles darlingi]|uniref:Uncharacterized protein n=1 Tax=Anopheles darlingi TaxID=43151 RepID=W5JPF5_ANODA|nr:hypothetical protein AND_003478 [Anopheles darlingi]